MFARKFATLCRIPTCPESVCLCRNLHRAATKYPRTDPKVDCKLIRDTRKRLRCSRTVFARRLRITERTLEKWEQGRAKPNPQAAALVLLVRGYPDTLARLDAVAAR